MSNKSIGTAFEYEFCDMLAEHGYWAHRITPDIRGAQPFDIIAAKNGVPLAVDCKTCVANSFSMNRLEDNQIMAFELWLKCGNGEPFVAVKHKEKVYLIGYLELKKKGSVSLKERSDEWSLL